MKFKVGDKVKVIKKREGAEEIEVGDVGIVKIIDTGSILNYGIEFERRSNSFHTCWCNCRPYHGYWCGADQLELVRDFKVGQFYKVGDGLEKDNIIKITKVTDTNCTYESSCARGIYTNIFDIGSIFSNYLILLDNYVADNNGGKITIRRYDNKVVAEDNNGHKAIARCCPEDVFDFETGAKLAFDRLVCATNKNKVREVKRAAKVGEYIKIVNASGCSYEEYVNGDILKVVKYSNETYENGVHIQNRAYYQDSIRKYADLKEYVVLENYKPEEHEAHEEIKEGDTVRVIDPKDTYCNFSNWLIGNISDKRILCAWKRGTKPNRGNIGRVIKIAKHGGMCQQDKLVALIKVCSDRSNYYIMDLNGLEKC